MTPLATDQRRLLPAAPAWRGLTPSPEILLDSAAVRAALTETAAAAASRSEIRPAAVAVLRQAHAEGRAMIAAEIAAAPREAHRAIHDYAWLIDRIVELTLDLAARWLHPLATPTASERISALAVGGYGRAEMAPFSDVDLLFVTPYKQTPWGESLIESVLYCLWDLRLKVGQAVRTVDECLRQARAGAAGGGVDCRAGGGRVEQRLRRPRQPAPERDGWRKAALVSSQRRQTTSLPVR